MKSFSLVAVIPVGADAVTASKLAVDEPLIPAATFTKLFLK